MEATHMLTFSINNYHEALQKPSKPGVRGQKDLKLVGKKCSGLYSVLSEKVQRTRQKLSTRAQYIGFSVVEKWKVFYAIHNPSAKECFTVAEVEYWL